MAILTHEEQPILGSVRFAGMPTHRAGFAGIVGVYLNGHAFMQERFVGDHAMQFGKGPLAVGGIGLPLLLGNRFGAFAVFLAPSGSSLGALTNVGQILQADEAVGVLADDAFGNDMIGILRSPVSLAR